MKWDIFSDRKRERQGNIRDEINDLIRRIEKFAPRKYRSERASRYYNYQLLDPYLKALYSLLSAISKKQDLKDEKEDFIREIFLKLKDFYDPKKRLSLTEAIEDKNLLRRLAQIFLIFYGIKDLKKEELIGGLEKLGKNQ